MFLEDADGFEGEGERFVYFALEGVDLGQVAEAEGEEHGVDSFDFGVGFGLFKDGFGLVVAVVAVWAGGYRRWCWEKRSAKWRQSSTLVLLAMSELWSSIIIL